jgi:hypothetical protein
MSACNVLWGAPRLHSELLKLGIEVSQATVAKYMVKHRKPPSPSWRTFLENHVKQLVSIDFFVVPTVTFRILNVFLVLAHDRRRIERTHLRKTRGPRAQAGVPHPTHPCLTDLIDDSQVRELILTGKNLLMEFWGGTATKDLVHYRNLREPKASNRGRRRAR